MPDITPNTTVSPLADVLVQELPDGEMVLLDLAGENYFGLGETGARIWAELSRGRTILEVAESLNEDFEADVAVIEEDVLELVEQLVAAGLVALGDA